VTFRYHQAAKAKKLDEKKGILSLPDLKPGKTLSENTAKTITDFYNNDKISRVIPGKADAVPITVKTCMFKKD
jgi:hypothetical protein